MIKDQLNNVYKISDLSEIIKSYIPNKKIFRVSGEISQPSIRGGHIYFTLKDDFNNLKAIIWKSKNINKEQIIAGQQIVVDGKLDYYGNNSTINLIVDKIIQNDGIGELHKKYETYKQDFLNKGYFSQERKKGIPELLKNILVITSQEGAALQDFKINLENNKCNINCEIANVMVQGSDCPKNICDLLNKFKNDNLYYDLVVITRGGGSFEDLFGFSQPELIETIYNFHLPVLSAIGHQIDNPLLDLIADIACPTPSLAAQFIVDHNKKYINKLQQIKNDVKKELLDQLFYNNSKLSRLYEKIFVNLKNECKNIILHDLSNKIINLNKLESKLILNDGINIYNGNTKINNSNELSQLINSIVKLQWGGKEFSIKILS